MDKSHHHGLNLDFNPLIENENLKGGPPPQQQSWPGLDEKMQPRADHGEQSYVGGCKLEGKTALITGGDSGIGRAVAIAFAREGADIVLSYFNEHEDAQETAKWVEKAGRQILLLSGDIQKRDHCIDLVERTVNKFGRLNILVNNAGFHVENKFEDITEEQLEQTFQTNIFSFFWTTQAALPHLNPGDSIINTGSVVALMGHPKLIDYSCTKGAIHNFTKSMAQYLADRGIRVNCVAPGPVWTPLIASTRSEGKIEKFGADTYWNRAAQPAELAPSFVFLASSDSRYYTGEILSPTGFKFSSR